MTDPFSRDYDAIELESSAPGVTHLRLDRPTRLNAITEGLLDELEDALGGLDGHDGTQVLVVSGAGSRAFSIGADLRDTIGDIDEERARELSRRGQAVFEGVARFPGPVVASVDGYCLGGGMELAAAADLRVASPDSTFGQPEQEHGLVPGWGGTQRLQRIVGSGRASEIVLTAQEYDAETMERYGFLNWLSERPFEAACERARSLTEHPPDAQEYAKRALRRAREGNEAGFQFESEAFGRLAERVDEM